MVTIDSILGSFKSDKIIREGAIYPTVEFKEQPGIQYLGFHSTERTTHRLTGKTKIKNVIRFFPKAITKYQKASIYNCPTSIPSGQENHYINNFVSENNIKLQSKIEKAQNSNKTIKTTFENTAIINKATKSVFEEFEELYPTKQTYFDKLNAEKNEHLLELYQ